MKNLLNNNFWHDTWIDQTPVTHDQAICNYWYIYQYAYKILELMLESGVLVESEDLNKYYVYLREYLREIHKREDFRHVPIIDFSNFASLTQLTQKDVDRWYSQKQYFIDQLRILEGLKIATRYQEFPIYINLRHLISGIETATGYYLEDIEKAKNKTTNTLVYKPLPEEYRWNKEKTIFNFGDKGSLDFKRISDRKKLFALLVEAKGYPVDIKYLSKRIGKTKAKTRIVLNQINDRFKIHQLSNLASIISNYGAYRLQIKPL